MKFSHGFTRIKHGFSTSRFHELAVKSATGAATAGEEAKLDRYQRLRRSLAMRDPLVREEIRNANREHYRAEHLLRRLSRLVRTSGIRVSSVSSTVAKTEGTA